MATPKLGCAVGFCLLLERHQLISLPSRIKGSKIRRYWSSRFSRRHLSHRCFVSQSATLFRRTAWEAAVGGLDENLWMA
ncbi:MAG: hypothetical protein ACYDBT_02285 [Desulfobulbaceae bacterium]